METSDLKYVSGNNDQIFWKFKLVYADIWVTDYI
jgi:hypothetical protein